MSMKIKRTLLKARQMLCLEAAVRYGSISKAAEKNNMKQSNLSVQIKLLEEELGETLLTRVSHGIKLTEPGYEIYSMACDLRNVINKAENLNIKAFRIEGAIRLWTSDGLGIGYLSDCFADFYLHYPKVKIEVFCSLDIPEPDQFDMAIVYEEPTSKALKVVNKYELNFGMFASKQYLSRYGCPKNMKDVLENHRICTRSNYTSVWPKWKEVTDQAKQIAATTNSSAMLLQLIKDGIGIGLLPVATANKEPDLIYLSNLKLYLKHKFWIVVRDEVKNLDKIVSLIKFIEAGSQKL